MLRIAQALSILFVAIFVAASMTSIFLPETLGQASGFNPTTDYGLTNVRTLGAPLLSLAIITLLGARRKEWLLLLPASLYFFFNGSARVISLFFEQYDPVMLRGLVLTFGLFVLSQIALHTFRLSKKEQLPEA
ncbi:hypothetical protein EYS14_11085 [Alteromonadaceae bacterium M269]|nr:hypothetical protein EYS14_11085 [Alteromonadaceae bacterium M269]